jgi:hypothetical protein
VLGWAQESVIWITNLLVRIRNTFVENLAIMKVQSSGKCPIFMDCFFPTLFCDRKVHLVQSALLQQSCYGFSFEFP